MFLFLHVLFTEHCLFETFLAHKASMQYMHRILKYKCSTLHSWELHLPFTINLLRLEQPEKEKNGNEIKRK